ncbi:MAG: GrpB family protein [Bacteroides sp.]|nr:GrpB family protein [Bacteroides sp.]
MKSLNDLTLQELWDLFPIVLVPYNPEWKLWAKEEIDLLQSLLRPFKPRISHVGSTSIGGILSKPIIDLIVELPPGADVRELMEANGYICMNESPRGASFNKGYTPEGYAERVFHIHCRRYGDAPEIRFRDHLIANPEVAQNYEQLKLRLLSQYPKDRDAYTAGKSPFIASLPF